ncbi:PREDICTED: glutamate receptor 2-like [Branchiostoma belcheri]|uniref:Glutamate receptor 2-like n=1 Tax=Branchiostoma belcheri TaxID=7741 RepID=A0A6P4Z2X3_BRABE|nr:PREDICTED: glutamate receptor 2-like [Branchiostoma belcheri]
MKVDGAWTGMMSQLINKEIDMAMGLFITMEREKYVDFSKPLLEEHLEILVKKPEKNYARWWHSTYGIMSSEVWFIVAMSFLLVGIVMFVIIRVSPYENRAFSAEVGEASRLSTFGHSLWICYSAMSWQGVDYSPRSVSGRFLFVFWFGFIVWTLILVTGAIAAYFLASPVSFSMPPVKSFNDLAAAGGFRPALISGSPAEIFFKDSQVASYRRIYDRAVKVTSVMEGLKQVRLGGTALICQSTTARFHSNQKPCDLMYTHNEQGLMGRRAVGIGVQKGSPLQGQLNDAILRLKEDGTLHELYQKWTGALEGQCPANRYPPDNPPASKQPAFQYYTLGVPDVLPLFVALLVAAILALCIMGVEVLWDKRQSKETRKAAPPVNMTADCEDTNI